MRHDWLLRDVALKYLTLLFRSRDRVCIREVGVKAHISDNYVHVFTYKLIEGGIVYLNSNDKCRRQSHVILTDLGREVVPKLIKLKELLTP